MDGWMAEFQGPAVMMMMMMMWGMYRRLAVDIDAAGCTSLLLYYHAGVTRHGARSGR